jgi:hypothetical protein
MGMGRKREEWNPGGWRRSIYRKFWREREGEGEPG